jgi:hypothetical protein
VIGDAAVGWAKAKRAHHPSGIEMLRDGGHGAKTRLFPDEVMQTVDRHCELAKPPKRSSFVKKDWIASLTLAMTPTSRRSEVIAV